LFLRRFGVPCWALARVFGRDAMYLYRQEIGLGRFSVVGTTVRRGKLPIQLLADEHHERCDGEKVYVATTVGAGCCLGAEAADAPTLTKAYRVFQEKARDGEPDYAPQTVSTDGWKSTQAAWKELFPTRSGKRDRFAYGILGLFAVAVGERNSHRDAKATDLTLLAGCGMALL